MLNKILFTIFAIIAIWKAFSLISKLSNSRAGPLSRSGSEAKRPDRPRPSEPKAVEMQPCPRCGAYVDPREGCRCGA
jgi:hypothetical protein